MTEPPTEGQPWWHGRAGSPPDIEALLGPEAMSAVGGVADEALKLFVVIRDRFGTVPGAAVPGADPDQPRPDAVPSPLATMLGQLASGAMHAAQDLMSAAQPRDGAPGADSDEPAAATPVVAPGEAAACSYCPICQAIALFRSVPMSTWQRMAQSVIEVADAARDYAGRAQENGAVTVEPYTPQGGSADAVGDFLRSIDEPGDDG